MEPRIHAPTTNHPLSDRKGCKAHVIHDDLVATLGAEPIASSTVTNYLLAVRIMPCDAITLSDTTSPPIDKSDKAILRALMNSHSLQFASLHRQHLYQEPPDIGDYPRNLGLPVSSPMGAAYPIRGSEGNTGPMISVPSDDTVSTRNQRRD
jgi:hypothetical protein